MSNLLKTVALTEYILDDFDNRGMCSEQARMELYENVHAYYEGKMDASTLVEYVEFIFGTNFNQENIDQANRAYQISMQLYSGKMPDEIEEMI